MNLSETMDVLEAISSLRESSTPMALATIVSVRGSTYRRPGARLLVPASGDSVGNLSGGCLEGEVEALAREVMSTGRARLSHYDLTADDEVVWGWGLGCNGAIEVFVEPAGKAAEVAEALRLAIERERTLAVATVVESNIEGVEVGARVLVYPDGATKGTLGAPEADAEAISVADSALRSGESVDERVPLHAGELRVFVEVLKPPLRLLLCGAGHDAIPVVRLASSLGWRTVVVDDREDMLDKKRFPGASDLIAAEPARAAEIAAVDDRTYAIVMSHNYLRDRDYLRSFLDSGIRYIGMLGPRARLERLLDDLSSQGIVPSVSDAGRIHGPAGLDLGGEGPEEIAAAIVAEVLAVSRGRDAGFLRDRSGPIHERRERAGAG
jgi:xanthine/CO dehydrogenase XdhC/CoxF family maturation factor